MRRGLRLIANRVAAKPFQEVWGCFNESGDDASVARRLFSPRTPGWSVCKTPICSCLDSLFLARYRPYVSAGRLFQTCTTLLSFLSTAGRLIPSWNSIHTGCSLYRVTVANRIPPKQVPTFRGFDFGLRTSTRSAAPNSRGMAERESTSTLAVTRSTSSLENSKGDGLLSSDELPSVKEIFRRGN